MSFSASNWALKVNRSGLLKTGEAFLLMVLANYADDDWSCFPSQEQLACDTAQGKRTIVRQLNRLKELGLVVARDRYGRGRGRIGNMYFLVRESLDLGLENREIERSARMAPKPENGDIPRSANMASERLKCHSRHDSSANHDISPQVLLKDHARINHHHQSSDARDATIDDDLNYLGVEVGTLFRCFPELEDHVDESSIKGLIDTVLGRARARVANPTAYVRRALETDFYGLALQHQAQSAHSRPPITSPEPFQDTPRPTEPTSHVPRWEDVLADADPCVNPDHWESLSPEQFSNCPQCRIERRIGEQPRHVSTLSDEALQRYPAWLREWAAQAKAAWVA